MLSFAVFHNNPCDWSDRQAHLLGPDDVPVQADIRYADGLLRCEKRSGEAGAVCLLAPVDGLSPEETMGLWSHYPGLGLGPGLGLTMAADGDGHGHGGAGGGLAGGAVGVAAATSTGTPPCIVMLQTCLLPERERPYLLSLELARHRLMQVLNKLEDWALFDLPSDDVTLRLFESARQAFTAALVEAARTAPHLAHANGAKDVREGPLLGGGAGGYSVKADQLARRALSLAMEAGDGLTLRQSKIQHSKRMTGELAAAAATILTPPSAITDHEAAVSRAALIGSAGVILPTPPQVGCVISPAQFSPQLQKIVSSACDFLAMPMRWIEMEPTEGKYAFASTDRWIEWAVRQARLPISAGPLIDFRKRCVPEWLYIWEHDYETLRELVYEHVKTVVTRYRRTVSTWTAVSGLQTGGDFSFTFEQMMDLTRLCVTVIKKLQPSAKVIVEVDRPWGEYYAENPRTIPPILFAETISQTGVQADLLGLRIEMGHGEPGRATRDLMALSALLDKYAGLERPISLTISAPSEAEGSHDGAGVDGPRRRGRVDSGCWRGTWTQEGQARWLTAVTAVATSKPFVHSVCWHELYETGGIGGGRHDGLISASGQPKLAMHRLAEIRQSLREKKSPLGLTGKASAGPS